MMETLAFIGLGRVGGALAVLLSRAGFQVAAVCDQNQEQLDSIAGQLDSTVLITTDAVQAARAASVVFLTVQDRFIAPLCEQLAAAGAVG
ncbi:MAG: NAD(P)-binding domain-containing protein, partial [Xanthomonadaceae bacterium]|nr:NAD(P)-binding domain-containing protein [Xanthomonadaceae bacterium]